MENGVGWALELWAESGWPKIRAKVLFRSV
jgi:hypothetical protein